ncbi:unnamed protein product [Linum tenue]|uniref:Ribosomal protein S15 n=1 Tax=Linum tenue TaxID=586396 RepID=A0AAV0R6I6_9ROSI|nr:unnamed protein product [Linum tenue]
MQKRLESLVEVLHRGAMEEDNTIKRIRRGRYIRKLITIYKRAYYYESRGWQDELKRLSMSRS